MSNQAKLVRGQLRQLLLEILPDILESEIVKKIMEEIRSATLKNLREMNERHKDTMSYLVRQVSTTDKKDVL